MMRKQFAMAAVLSLACLYACGASSGSGDDGTSGGGTSTTGTGDDDGMGTGDDGGTGQGCQSMASELTQYGVTWTFEGEHCCGTFANGDHWVLGPVTITGISPEFDGEHNGWEVNPDHSVDQGFDARVADYVPGRVPSLPHAASPGESIVKGVSLEPLDDTDCRPCLQTAAVLTVLGEVPPGDGESVFRPPYFGPDKPFYLVDDLDLGLLPSLAPVADTPTLEDTVTRFQRVQLDHKENWTGRALHPVDNLPDYGSSIASRNAEGALRLMLDDDEAAKMDAAIAYVQYGIDIYHSYLGGVTWPPNGGHMEGRKLPLTLTAVLLGDQAMQQAVADSAREDFGENGGMYYSSAAEVVLYGQQDNTEESYWTNIVFDTGSRTIRDPYAYVDGGYRPGDSYQFCCLSLPWKSTAAALYVMEDTIPVWNHEDFFTYVDRWVELGAWATGDPCAPADGTCSGGDNDGAPCTSASESDVCTGDDAFCDLTVGWDAGYGVTYGPDGSGGCILDEDPSDGTGRFPLLHGASTDDGHYGSAFAEAMWDAYVP